MEQLIEDSRKPNQQKVVQLLEDYDNFLFDCDGVLWEAGAAHPHVVETMALLREMGKKVFFVTNNSSKSRITYSKRFEGLKIQSTTDEIYCSAYAAVARLVEERPQVKKAYVVGFAGICDELKAHGIDVVGGPDHADAGPMTEATFRAMEVDHDCDAVVVGWDCGFNFYKLAYASNLLRRQVDSGPDKPCGFYATNRDMGDLVAGRLIPGGGCMVACVEHSAGVKAVDCGKPTRWLSDKIVSENNLDRSRTLMVGDRLETDILFGQNGDIDTLLVMTGVTNKDVLTDALKAGDIVPTYVLPQLGDIYVQHKASQE